MSKLVGLWLDHEKAFLVSLDGDRVTTGRMESGVEGRVRCAGGSRSRTPWGPQDVVSESGMEERRKHQLRRYYQRVIAALEDARRILILGPGEAKVEFEKEMRKSTVLSAKIAAVEPADKLTEKQLVARVKEFFTPDALRR